MRFKINLPPETRAQETKTIIDTMKRPCLQNKSPSPTSQRSPEPPIKLFLKLYYRPAPSPPSTSSSSGTTHSTASNPTITTPRALTCLTINSLVFAATLLSKSGTSDAFQAAKFLIDQAQQFGDIGVSLQQAYDADLGTRNRETFNESLGNLFEAVFYSMSMLRHELSDSAEGVKITIQYEDAFQRLSERDEEMDEDEENEFVPTGFGFTQPADKSGSLSDDWPHQEDSISFNININSWRRLALLSIATFQFSAAIAQKIGSVEDALFLAQQSACLENMGEIVCRHTSVAGGTFSNSAERAKLYVFGILTGLWEEYKNYEDDTSGVLDEELGYFVIFEELKTRLGSSNEPQDSRDIVSGEEGEEDPDHISIDLEHMELSERYIESDAIQETEGEFSEHTMEGLDDITIPERGVTDLDEEMPSDSEEDSDDRHMEQVEGVALSGKYRVGGIANIVGEQFHEVPHEELDEFELSEVGNTELGQDIEAEVSEIPLKDMWMMTEEDMMAATKSANRVEDNDSEFSEMSIEELNTLMFIGSNKRMAASADENNDYTANDNVPISRTREGGRKKFPEQPSVHAVEKDRQFECDECDKTYSRSDGLKGHKTTIHGISDKPYSCADCDKEFWGKHQLQEHKIVCEKKFTAKRGLTEHQQTVHTGEKHFKCEECGKEFARKAQLTVHVRVHSGEILFECGECGRTFRTLGNLKAHQRTAVHTPFICEDCDKKFKSDNELAEHQHVDCKPKRFHCSDCESKFARKDGLLRHRGTVHGAGTDDGVQKGRNDTKNKQFQCRECGRGYSRSDSLARHDRRFHGEDANGKPFQCDSCGKRFTRNGQLAKHEVYCNGSDVSESERDDEEEMEDEDKMDAIVKAVSGPPFHCDCGKSYASLYSLSRHLRTRNGPVHREPETRDGEEMDVDADGETDIEVDIGMGAVNDGNELSDTK